MIEPLLTKHRDLSIDAALRYLRTGTVERKVKKWDHGRFIVDQIWSQMLRKTWNGWSDEEKECLRTDCTLFEDMMRELRFRNLRQNVRSAGWKKYLDAKEQAAYQKWLYAGAHRSMAIQAIGFVRGVESVQDWREFV